VKSFALALGAGGARGLAHIAVIEALDDLGIRPVAIAGTSVGAMVGAAYAAGLSGKAIRRHVLDLAFNRAEVIRRLMGARAVTLSSLLSAPFSNPVLLDPHKFCAAFLPEGMAEDFAGLQIPLVLVATDLHDRREVVFSSGPLRPAIAASMAIPGLVRPLELDGRVLIDGGAVDPLPFLQLRGRADVIVAVDCSGEHGEPGKTPGPWESVFAAITIMGQAIVAEKLKQAPPELVLRPNVGFFGMLDFLQANAILRIGEQIIPEVKAKLTALLAD
jgi:NTE family protein